jgi:hypothetical protein
MELARSAFDSRGRRLQRSRRAMLEPLLSPKHPLADEAVTKIPRSRMRIVLNMIEYWECWFDMDMMDDIPPPLLIENSDGRAITVEQFIVEVSKYAESLRDTIYEIEDRGPWQKEDARVYYFLITGPKYREAEDPDVVFAIHHISDITNSVRDFEDEWVRKERGLSNTTQDKAEMVFCACRVSICCCVAALLIKGVQ